MKQNLRINVASSLGGLEKLAKEFNQFADANRIPYKTQYEMRLALDEAVTNIIMHGYGMDETRRIVVELLVQEGMLEIEVIDDAPPFSLMDVQDPDTETSIEERPIGGLGVYLVKRLADEVVYRRRGDQNHLIMRRRIEEDDGPRE